MSIRVHFLDDKRKALYGEIFPDGAPVTSPLPTLCQLNGAGEYECYMLDLDEVGAEKLEVLSAVVARKFQANPVEVMNSIILQGMPIRADQTTLVVDGPQLGLLMPDAVADDGLVSIRGRYMPDDEDLFDDDDDYYDDDDED